MTIRSSHATRRIRLWPTTICLDAQQSMVHPIVAVDTDGWRQAVAPIGVLRIRHALGSNVAARPAMRFLQPAKTIPKRLTSASQA